ncbi:MAG: carbamoyl-phosphate synthase (glutamine-hydrolyzing) large subunit [Acidobacteria bacterium]|nr:carbamoyl-phosphate synthase (glutamine-hydrolyzing) large subunit [Acidobacteriota bacterium]
MPLDKRIQKVLIIGSGGVRVGQAAEFDYSGSQALKALREEGIKTVLLNPNVATLQTSHDMTDSLYLEPITPEFVEQVIQLEKPDGVLLSFGGQTALNIGVELEGKGVFERYGVRILGTPIEAVKTSEDRESFKRALDRVGAKTAPSRSAHSTEEAEHITNELGFPVMLRPAYILGGLGSQVVRRKEDLEPAVRAALMSSPIGQVLVEKYLHHWKEVEYEMVRDGADNCIAVCNMENFDPLGIHTGDSIVVAPSQTLTNSEYHRLRAASIRIVRSIGIVGECNIQFALDPKSETFFVIEINARLSRSSALASKATGYPLAYVAAKLALGYNLDEITNKVTGVTQACFEPALDYIVVKVPKWEMRKFEGVETRIGSQMKSIGEVMSIGRRFEEALQKAVRMLELGRELVEKRKRSQKAIQAELQNPTDDRLFTVVDAFMIGMTVEEITSLSGIDPWFLDKIERIVDVYRLITGMTFGDADLKENLKKAKAAGFSDNQIASLMGTAPARIRAVRTHFGIVPAVKQIDTLAAEYPARTNYLYMTYNGTTDDIPLRTEAQVFVIGAGPIRIGSSVEFDWCTMNCVWELKRKGYRTTVLNNNPETVSTDYDMSDKLYFEELTLERVLDIYEKENPLGVVVSVGGQTSNNLAYSLSKRNVALLGTFGSDVDTAEDRAKFSAILDRHGIKQPPWSSFTTLDEGEAFAESVRYPVIIRPSYVLSGSAMKVARNKEELKRYITEATELSRDYPVMISKFITGAREVEVDGVCDGRRAFIGAVMEHIEDAGVHSGDATMVIPAVSIQAEIQKKIAENARIIARELGVRGPFNIQFMVKGMDIFVIECNLRASRSMPFTSKSIGVNLIQLATRCMVGEPLPLNLPRFKGGFFSVKMPMFSWVRFAGADPRLNVEMKSTGEIACMGKTFHEAFLKAALATESGIPLKGRAQVRGVKPSLRRRLEGVGFSLGEENPEIVIDLSPNGILRKKYAPRGIPVISEERFLEVYISALEEAPTLEAREIRSYWRLSGMYTELKVSKIESGTVIDHLPPNTAYAILEILNIRVKYPNSVVTMATNVQSGEYGVKDILKIEGKELSAEEINKVKTIAGRGTINIIKDYETVKKIKV